MALTFSLHFESFVTEFHVVEAFDCLLSSPWINIFKKAEASIIGWIVRVLLQHKFLEHAEGFAKLFDLRFGHGVGDAAHEKLVVVLIIYVLFITTTLTKLKF